MENKSNQRNVSVSEKGIKKVISNRMKWYLICALLAVLLGSAAFFAGHLFRQGIPTPESQDQETIKSEDGSITMTGVRLAPDERLPGTPPTASGQFIMLKDNCLYIHRYPASGMVILDKMDEYPIVEILVTRETLVYKDVTDLSNINHNGDIQQVVVDGSIEGIAKGSSIIIWGEMRGERIIAEVIQYF